jgi:hypothetical protein
MYLSPASLPLYHTRSQYDLMRLRGRFQSSSEGSVLFAIDSSLSFWNDGVSIRRASVKVSNDAFYPNTKYVVYTYLDRYGSMGKGEYRVSQADSNKAAQIDIGY